MAMKDVRDMGLDVVEVLLDDPKVGVVDIDSGMDVGCRSAGISNSKEMICLVEGNIRSQESDLVRGDCWESTLEVEEELKQERKKRDRALHKEKAKESRKEDERIVNVSLSDSDISNRMRVILREANNTQAIEKKLGFSVHGNEEDVIKEIMRAEMQ
ncbi:hypothetical protein GOBAR_AA01660 [Gossypium barbadense]|uniref:Uncharacterized protein n=1 Tax=Gossypium barbadense TaxID=3634 RepID=A0A2P5YTK9_GOSBA|nr:hypothetical protein GOBAR_AA01660 [Gossypium barbadense]